MGTLTGKPQSGNPQPRLFRLTEDKAIINRMGFNNQGADLAARRLARTGRKYSGTVLGINIGKTKIVPVENAVDDYLFSFERLFTFADYFTINVSSPNTPGLRSLQKRSELQKLLAPIVELNQQLAQDHDIPPKPILLKIAPDMADEDLDDVIAVIQETKIDGIIATNTTISRDGLKTDKATVDEIGAGGLSGAPLTLRSREVVSKLFHQLDRNIPIIGVGGISNGEDAWQMILAGASLIQVYTGFIYGGPSFVRDLNRHLLNQLEKHGLDSIEKAVGEHEKFG